MIESAVTFAVVLPSLMVAHHVADHWIQTDWQAKHKGDRDPWHVGHLACAAHVATYTLTTILFVSAAWLLFDLPISPAGFLLGQLVSAVTHYWADRRFTLERLCERLGKGNFYRLGAPREVSAYTEVVTINGEDYELHVYPNSGPGSPPGWDNPSLGTGAYALDQSWHWFWLFVAATGDRSRVAA